jgi:hypothetical protein
MRSTLLAFVVSFVALSLVADKGAMFVGLSFVADKKPGFVTGTVTEWYAGDSIRVANGQTGRGGFRLGLRRDTVYEGDTTRTIAPGVRVTVWYRNVGERRLMAYKVRVLDPVTR